MEVNFRPLPPSTAARRAAPGQAPSSDEGETFTEMIESLTSAENNPQAEEQSGRRNEKAKPLRKTNELDASGEEFKEEPPAATAQSSVQQAPANKGIGSHLDMLA